MLVSHIAKPASQALFRFSIVTLSFCSDRSGVLSGSYEGKGSFCTLAIIASMVYVLLKGLLDDLDV